MSFTVLREPLLAALDRAAEVAPHGNVAPILSCVLLAFGEGRLEVRATDLDRQIRTSLPAAGDAPFAFAVNANLLHKAARGAPEKAEIVFRLDDKGRIVMAAGRTRLRLPFLPPADFPELRTTEEAATAFDLAGQTLAALLEATLPHVPTETARYYLAGIYLCPAGGDLVAVATDGHTLGVIAAPLPDGAAGMPGVIVPTPAAQILAKLAKNEALHLAIGARGLMATVDTGDIVIELRVKHIDGTYPDWRRVVPTGNDKRFSFDAAALAAALARVTVVSDKQSVAVRCHFGETEIGLSCNNPAAGAAETAAPCRREAGPGEFHTEIGFNGRYLQTVCGHFKGEAMVALADAGAPVLFTPADPADRRQFVVMPLRV